MTLSVSTQAKYWGIAALVFFALLYLLGDVILPFLLGGAIAYFLDPIADKLEAIGFRRIWATVTITIIGLLVFTLMILLIVPTLVQQTTELFDAVPQIATSLREWLVAQFPDVVNEESVLRQSLDGVAATIQERGGELLNAILTSAQSVISVVVLLVVVPVVTFYLLWDWDRMVAAIDDLLPRDHAPTIRYLASEVDKTLASFIRGQGTVCLILGTFYAVALMIAGLSFGLIVGAIAGALTFIPYIGALVGGALAIGLAFFQFWGEWWHIAIVAGIFVIGQFLEGNFLTPNLVGSSVGLHPVWLIFALSAFGTLFGFVGMLVAVPVAAALGVVLRYFIGRYKEGRLYKGLSEGALLPEDTVE
ncbi:AI-2E family transporter [Maritimibacter sp. DP1N21-5]|uniref:AI-2E family transporter n=1 Tax=Maritimibacter sp. DP1N21-5 TaxID=2836867 RepID=UPI001C464186|nr:AI-2E family transporter [Maritimibacter sp. DP1N21-5]MBV7410476.1 AI-2E family transporter [Maritimibacter sp. DP1N21-5]